MRTVDDYCQAAMIRTNTKSLRQLADLLLISPTLPSQWKTRRAWPSDSVMKKLADLAGIREDIALLELAIWRTTADARPVYERMLDVISRTAAAALIAVAASALPAQNATAAIASDVEHNNNPAYTLCDIFIMAFP